MTTTPPPAPATPQPPSVHIGPVDYRTAAIAAVVFGLCCCQLPTLVMFILCVKKLTEMNQYEDDYLAVDEEAPGRHLARQGMKITGYAMLIVSLFVALLTALTAL